MLQKIEVFQKYLNNLYQSQGWKDYHSFTNSNFLLEETGEIAEVVLDTNLSVEEKRAKLVEEIGDVYTAILAVANHYDIPTNEIWKETSENTIPSDLFADNGIGNLTPYMELIKDLGLLAREIRRKEIGRHSHAGKEIMNEAEERKKFTESLMNALHSGERLMRVAGLDLEEVLQSFKVKMKRNYN